MIHQEAEKPTIKVYSAAHVHFEYVNQLFYGMEEEGVPFAYIEQERGTAATLSYQACRASVLGVGVGVDNQEIILHYEKLDEHKPLFRIPADSDPEEIRILGANSARLVKKEQFKTR